MSDSDTVRAVWLLICIPPIISQRPKVWPNHTKGAVIMVIYISGGLLALLLCGLICYVITRAKGWAYSTCWAHAIGGFLLGLFWLPVCISKPRYTPGCEKVCRMGAPAFGVWLAISTALSVIGDALLLVFAFTRWQYGALGIFLVPIGILTLLILDQRC